MKKLLEKLRSKKAAITGALVASSGALLTVGARAEGEVQSGTAAIQSSVVTALANTQSDVMSVIASVLPYALAIMGAVLVVKIGVSVFRTISGRR